MSTKPKEKTFEDLLTEVLTNAAILGIDLRFIEVSRHVYDELEEMAISKSKKTERPKDASLVFNGPLYQAHVVPRIDRIF